MSICLGSNALAQVINFDVPGGVSGSANYSGQGAYPDPGHNWWNPIRAGKTTAATNLWSDGSTHTPITLTSELGGSYGTQGTQGMAAGLQQPYEYNNAALQVDTLNNVPAGTYNLYLYGINNDGTRGTIYTVSTPIMSPVILATSNTPASLTSFTYGADYVVFSNVVVGSSGTITFTWVGNPDVQLAGNNEGDLNALQLVYVSANTLVTNSVPNFGPNVLLFNPSVDQATIQSFANGVFAVQQNNQFGTQRYTMLFYPGQYGPELDVNLGYYTQVLGLGQMPDDTVITGNVHSEGESSDNDNATVNFWRCCENFAVAPTNSDTMTWAVSQGCSLRRMHIEGSLNLSDTESMAYSSGGFLADSAIDDTVSSITQQQWLSRNDIWGNWSGGNWNMVFVGVPNAPGQSWPNTSYTTITNTPFIREKPYLSLDSNTNFVVMVPNLETNVSGTTWANGPTPATSIPISQFYIAQAGVDNAGSINAALNSGLNLILTPGVYNLTNSINVTNPDTVVLGLGYPTLVPVNHLPSMVISDVNGVKVTDIIFDAGTLASPALLEVGTATSSLNHSTDPICLYDICSRVGGATVGTTTNCVMINANDVIGDNFWLWRADHGNPNTFGWTQNPDHSGLVVNGDRVTIYGLANEHHEQYQTLWNGNWGRVYFYQSELPYDAPSQSVWMETPTTNGYASYKVANSVTSHQAYGLGIYGVFLSSTSACYNAVETPINQQVNVHDIITVNITAESSDSDIVHIINGTGNEVGPGFATATANSLWTNPSFSTSASFNSIGDSLAVTLPTESWRTYRLQVLNSPTSSNWLNIGNSFDGNDTLETVMTPLITSQRYYRVIAQ
ncbi:MAG TPA: hypothetical protein VNU95_10775 [Candidatus Acidoferrales bacterium]|nr:hypothetical protein [Candidatus Acidoferrales bacterium]